MDDPWQWQVRPIAERQAQLESVEAAEQFVRMFEWDADGVEEDQVVTFLMRAISDSGFDRPNPKVAIDLHDEDVLASLLGPGASETLADGYRPHGLVKDGVIHLHPEHLSQMNLLHELAHFIAPKASHGPVWCRVYVDLVTRTCGAERGVALLSELRQQGAQVADSRGLSDPTDAVS